MITLHKTSVDEFGNELQSKLEELILAFHTEILPDGESDTYVIDGEKKITGQEDLEKWLSELEKELKIQRSISGDACYKDPETGEVC